MAAAYAGTASATVGLYFETAGGDVGELGRFVLPVAPDLVASVSARVAERYEAMLVQSESRIVASPTSRQETRAHAEQIVFQALWTCLSPGTRPGGKQEADVRLARVIGQSRAAVAAHPSESLHAASTLFRAVFEVMEEQWPTMDAATVRRIAEAVESATTLRLRMAASVYVERLLESVSAAAVNERAVLGHHLHDVVAADLAAALYQLEVVAASHPDPRTDLVIDTIRHTVDHLRDTIADIRAWQAGSSLAEHLKRIAESSNIGTTEIDIAVEGDESIMDDRVHTELLLCLQEALRNSIAHAWARHIVVRVTILPCEVYAVLRDDGCGFDTASDPPPGHFGLATLRERLRSVGGRLTLMSNTESGTQVEIVVSPRVES